MFYNDLRNANVAHATTGSDWIHHFGSVTQDHMKMVLGISNNDILVKINDRKIYNQSWLERKLYRFKLKRNHQKWNKNELNKYGMTLHGSRTKNEFIWL